MASNKELNSSDVLAQRLIAEGQAIPHRIWLDGACGVVRRIGFIPSGGIFVLDIDVQRYLLEGIWVTDIESTGDGIETAWTLVYALPEPIGRERKAARRRFFRSHNFGESMSGREEVEDTGQRYCFRALPRPKEVEEFHRAMREREPASVGKTSRRRNASGEIPDKVDQILTSTNTKRIGPWLKSLGEPELMEFRASPEGKLLLKLLKLGAIDIHLQLDKAGNSFSNWIVVETPPAPLKAQLHKTGSSPQFVGSFCY